ncbi:hypothetical protein RhiJN_11171 [Ceratobasidium sp. AG-Ba]|nr:hypothetical protein RhiJN_11171 [Ceratobasidium sp. AG-Ba]
MDSPLTNAELSRLRKAINQRERSLSQGLSAATAESNISRALSNLKLFLAQSQPQLAAVLKDWEGADQETKSQIVAWIRQNVLGEQVPAAPISVPTPTPMPPPQPSTPQSKFIAPPPPPPLPAKAQSLPLQPQPISFSQVQGTSTPSPSAAARNTSPRPLPTPTHSHLRHSISLGQTHIRPTPTPPLRELHTQAALKPPTPPPKDHHHFRSASIRRASGPTAVEQLTLSAQGLKISQFANESQPSFATSPITGGSSSHLGAYSPPGEIRPNVSYVTRPQASTRSSGHSQTEPVHPQLPSPSQRAYTFPTNPHVAQPQAAPTAQILSEINTAQQQSYQKFFSQLAQSSANATNRLLEAMKKYQNHSAQSQPSTLQPPGSPSGGDSFAQVLAAYQQQQQQQTNQILAALQQQQQQSTPAYDPYQLLAQSQQQNQDFANLISQIQANSSPVFNPGQTTDFANMLAQMQTNTPGLDVNSLMSAMGGNGAGIDWASVAGMVMSGTDPTGMAAMAMQGSGLF